MPTIDFSINAFPRASSIFVEKCYSDTINTPIEITLPKDVKYEKLHLKKFFQTAVPLTSSTTALYTQTIKPRANRYFPKPHSHAPIFFFLRHSPPFPDAPIQRVTAKTVSPSNFEQLSSFFFFPRERLQKHPFFLFLSLSLRRLRALIYFLRVGSAKVYLTGRESFSKLAYIRDSFDWEIESQ